jgi:hypothetical protein
MGVVVVAILVGGLMLWGLVALAGAMGLVPFLLLMILAAVWGKQ